MGHTPVQENSQRRTQTRTSMTPRIPPEDNVLKRCSLQSMEPLREWFCKGADMTSPAEYEAAPRQLPQTFANSMPTLEKRDGHTSLWKVSSSLLLLLTSFRGEKHWLLSRETLLSTSTTSQEMRWKMGRLPTATQLHQSFVRF